MVPQDNSDVNEKQPISPAADAVRGELRRSIWRDGEPITVDRSRERKLAMEGDCPPSHESDNREKTSSWVQHVRGNIQKLPPETVAEEWTPIATGNATRERFVSR
jgi:hypothetical protein